MTARVLLSVALFITGSASVQAQVGRDVVERTSNRAQISGGQEALERDSKELAGFSPHLAAIRQASESGDEASANQALADLQPLLRSEVEQGAAKAEVKRSARLSR